MRLSKLFYGALLLISTAHAQQTPWAALPLTKKTTTVEGDAIVLQLKLDTLAVQKEEQSSPYYFQAQNWYAAPAAKVGYGYISAQGKPYGIWRYYHVNKGVYELFCEGTYTSLTTANLSIEPEWLKRFPAADYAVIKRDYVQQATDCFYFTGEWRFYAKGKLDKIIVMSQEAILPLEVAVEDGGISKLLLRSSGTIRLTGTPLSTISFSPTGHVKQLLANGVNLSFNNEGKPIIDPMIEMSIIE